jgi:hypothetical protein
LDHGISTAELHRERPWPRSGSWPCSPLTSPGPSGARAEIAGRDLATHGEEREILLALARAEERHAAHWSAKLHGAGQMPLGPGVRSRVLSWLARRVGSLFVLSLVQRTEAGSASQIALLAGLAGLLAGTLSMAAGEYISVRSQRELLDAAAHELDAVALHGLREHEVDELALIFRARGLPAEQAQERATELLGETPGDPAVHEGGDGEDVVGSAAGAARTASAP